MKSIALHLLPAILLFAAANPPSALAQAPAGTGASSQKAPNPSFLNQVYYYWADSLLPCPKGDGRMGSKMKALGFGGSSTGYTMDGERSALRIRAGDTLRFAVRSANGGMMDPSMMFALYKFDAKKGSRQAMLGSQGRFGGGSDPKNVMPFDAQKSGTDVFILIPSSRLAPGEYGFMNKMQMNGSGMNMSYTFYTFGIDP